MSNGRRVMLIWEMRGHALSDRLAELQAAAPEFDVKFFGTRDEVEANVRDAEIVATLGLSADALKQAAKLRWLHDWGAGMDKMLRRDMIASPVVLTCTKGSGGIPMAEWAIMHMLMWVKNAEHYLQANAAHRWSRLHNGELSGMTVGILGLGNAGADLAVKCKAFHMKVLGFRRSPRSTPYVDEQFTQDQLPELLSRSDFVVVTLPLTQETRGLLGEREIRSMKPGAYLIVASRAGIVPDDVLLRALNEAWIAGAALDAHSKEPLPPDSPFWSARNAFISPHCSATGQLMGERSADIFIENVRLYLSGKPLINVVDRAAGY